jgi:hypothetical protein
VKNLIIIILFLSLLSSYVIFTKAPIYNFLGSNKCNTSKIFDVNESKESLCISIFNKYNTRKDSYIKLSKKKQKIFEKWQNNNL